MNAAHSDHGSDPASDPGRAGRGVVFVCDAGPRLGIGHVMRCLALAEELQGRGVTVTLVADLSEVPWVAEQVRRRHVRTWVPDDADPVGSRLEAVRSLAPDAVVVDSYVLPSSFYDTLHARGAAAGRRVLALTDGDPGDRVADLYLDQNIGAEDDDWPLPGPARRLAGLGYALLRNDVLAHRPDAPRCDDAAAGADDPAQVLAFFGGTDAYEVAPRAAELLISTGVPWRATVVAATPALREQLLALTPGPGQVLDVVDPIDDIAALIASADVVVSAAGTSSWELLCLGAATAFVCVADNQVVSYERVVAEGLGAGLGRVGDLSSPDAREALRVLLTDPERRNALRRTAWARVDGRGRARVADALLAAALPAGVGR